jgi:serine phosphatase RsbU (regulator of sigma subunit)/anti-sigma regulatory factor (Ser/Thr protein kinase)
MKKTLKKSLSRRITVYFLIILVLTVAVSAAWNLYSTRQSILDMEKTQSEGCAQIISGMLSHYGASALNGGRNTEDYRYVRDAVRNNLLGFGMDAMYIYSLDTQTRQRRLLLAVAADEEENRRLEHAEDTGSYLNIDLISRAEEALLSDEDQLQRAEWKTSRGNVFAWLALHRDSVPADPIPGDSILFCMEYDVNLEAVHILRDFLEDILPPVIALIAAFLVLIWLFRKKIAMPIRLISDRMESFARDSRKKPEPLNIRSDDEIGEIASSFEKMTADISAYVGNIEKLTQERVETDMQMSISRRIQNGLVPEKAGIDDDKFNISAMTRPAKAVGGDFYECFRRDDNSVCIVMGDVSGKGITGAIFMAVIKTIIREKLIAGLSPAETLNQANGELMAQNPEGLFATVFAAILYPDTGELHYANAGHTYPILTGAAPEILKPANGIALGLFDDAEIVDETMTLAPGRGIVLYTDGVTDALNPAHERFGMQRLLDTLADTSRQRETAGEILLRVSSAVGAYCAGVEPFDDMAMLILLRADKKDVKDLRPLPVTPVSFEEVKQALFARAGDSPETRKALLACDEALSNIARYSGATELAFGCKKHENTLCVTFVDNGIPFDPTAVRTEEKEFEELDNGGMGLNLIRRTVSSARYERRDEKNHFTMVFPLPQQET